MDDKLKGKSSRQTFNEKRNYEPLCCGSSGEDLLIITACFIVLWGAITGYFVLLLHAALETADTGTVLWVFFGLFLVGIFVMSIIIKTGEYERKRDGEYVIFSISCEDIVESY